MESYNSHFAILGIFSFGAYIWYATHAPRPLPVDMADFFPMVENRVLSMLPSASWGVSYHENFHGLLMTNRVFGCEVLKSLIMDGALPLTEHYRVLCFRAFINKHLPSYVSTHCPQLRETFTVQDAEQGYFFLAKLFCEQVGAEQLWSSGTQVLHAGASVETSVPIPEPHNVVPILEGKDEAERIYASLGLHLCQTALQVKISKEGVMQIVRKFFDAGATQFTDEQCLQSAQGLDEAQLEAVLKPLSLPELMTLATRVYQPAENFSSVFRNRVIDEIVRQPPLTDEGVAARCKTCNLILMYSKISALRKPVSMHIEDSRAFQRHRATQDHHPDLEWFYVHENVKKLVHQYALIDWRKLRDLAGTGGDNLGETELPVRGGGGRNPPQTGGDNLGDTQLPVIGGGGQNPHVNVPIRRGNERAELIYESLRGGTLYDDMKVVKKFLGDGRFVDSARTMDPVKTKEALEPLSLLELMTLRRRVYQDAWKFSVFRNRVMDEIVRQPPLWNEGVAARCKTCNRILFYTNTFALPAAASMCIKSSAGFQYHCTKVHHPPDLEWFFVHSNVRDSVIEYANLDRIELRNLSTVPAGDELGETQLAVIGGGSTRPDVFDVPIREGSKEAESVCNSILGRKWNKDADMKVVRGFLGDAASGMSDEQCCESARELNPVKTKEALEYLSLPELMAMGRRVYQESWKFSDFRNRVKDEIVRQPPRWNDGVAVRCKNCNRILLYIHPFSIRGPVSELFAEDEALMNHSRVDHDFDPEWFFVHSNVRYSVIEYEKFDREELRLLAKGVPTDAKQIQAALEQRTKVEASQEQRKEAETSQRGYKRDYGLREAVDRVGQQRHWNFQDKRNLPDSGVSFDT